MSSQLIVHMAARIRVGFRVYAPGVCAKYRTLGLCTVAHCAPQCTWHCTTPLVIRIPVII